MREAIADTASHGMGTSFADRPVIYLVSVIDLDCGLVLAGKVEMGKS